MNHEWRPVPGFEGLYEVSDSGQIRNARPSQGRPAGYVLSTPVNPTTGNAIVRLYGPQGGKTLAVHRLVARAFHGEPPVGARAKRLNGHKADNRATNLEWEVTS
ncbi:NUMOD4 domain-containing protein [Microbacterium sp. H1-D42]|uniref:NUMOD4 domain-containing protein n=1 Tax=Microbacterium sp. H1-D42 TaxID=2925844 RepID=UPI001F53B95D|nr:NUMOD4 domain-containing protein [Microbacterium sp. H1-D42]UNK71739.1 NUMOD4 motif-containing HNH endonuclease [Microbacterium sp. H1-D42]